MIETDAAENPAMIRKWKLSEIPFYPLLIAAYFPLDLMAADVIGTVSVTDVVRPLVVCVTLALVTTLILNRALRDLHRAALWVAMAFFIICFFRLLRQMTDAIAAILNAELSGIYTLGGALVVTVLIGWMARPGVNLTRIANVIIGVMVAFPVVTLAQRSLSINMTVAAAGTPKQSDSAFDAVQQEGDRPNIIHIVLDGYSRADVLARYYGFDNSGFLDGLKAMGFAVADGATSPYSQTLQSMTSIFTADNLDGIGVGRAGADLRNALWNRLRHNPVMGTLSRLGYQTAALDIRYDPVRMDQLDRLLDRHTLSNFEVVALRKTVLYQIALKAGFKEATVPAETFTKPYERDLTEPYFEYLHLLAPHPPFDVTRNGEVLPPENGFWTMNDGSHFTGHLPERQEVYRHGYIEKLIYTNDGVLSLVRRVISEAKRTTIIIVHGDHGGGKHFDHDSAEQSCMGERFAPLLAVYASDGRLQRALPGDINLTNLYRVVFNTYFGTQMPMLPPRSVFIGWKHPEMQQTITVEEMAQTCG
jgi:hypothetical protein